MVDRAAARGSFSSVTGLRPLEALALEWQSVRGWTLLVEAANVAPQVVGAVEGSRRPAAP